MREKGYLRSDYASRAVRWLKGFFDPGLRRIMLKPYNKGQIWSSELEHDSDSESFSN